MSARRVAVVGSGIVGSAVAYVLAARGLEVTVFEKGPDYPYPHEDPFLERVRYGYRNPTYELPEDLRRMTSGGGYPCDHAAENVFAVGGSGTVWSALVMRMVPSDFQTRGRFGFGDDWPIGYDDLEPHLCAAEELMGVSGTDDDNPFAPPRSRPYPLPPFELTPDDRWFAEGLARDGIHMHTTPQARTRLDFGGRPACVNYGECRVCPIGARYSPHVHLNAAVAGDNCRLVTGTTVRRVLTDATGRARGVLARPNDAATDVEHDADVVIVAGAALESARLLLLSRDQHHPDGLGNAGGHVGRHLALHHVWTGHMHYRERLFAGRAGYWTGQSHQFCDPPTRGQHGGVKLELTSRPWAGHAGAAERAMSLGEALERFEITRRCRQVGVHAESRPTDGKYVRLSETVDRFGDPVAHVHYDLDDFDQRTYDYGRSLFERVARATGATEWEYRDIEDFHTYAHYMGTTRMGNGPADGVTDPLGRVHGTPGLFAVGLGNFVGGGGSVNPTLVGVAIALRAAEAIAAGTT